MLVSFDPRDATDRAGILDLLATYGDTPVAHDPAPAADPVAGVELDANGTPWLADVHSGNRKKAAKSGVWMKKRGVDDTVLATAEANARAKIAGTPQPTTPTAPVVAPEAMPTNTCTIEEVSAAWEAAVAAKLVDGAQFQAYYDHLGIDGTQLGVNETMRVKLRDFLAGLKPVAPAGLPGL